MAPGSTANDSCPNCGGEQLRDYCADCGQARPRAGDYSIKSLWTLLVENFTSYDSRILRTAHALLFRPGQLARDHYDGKRERYFGPLRLFFLANVAALVALLGIGAVLAPIYRLARASSGAPWAATYIQLYANLWFQHFTMAPLLLLYLIFAMKRAYALTWGQTVWRAILVTLIACTIARAFFDIAFALVLLFA